MHIHTDLIIPQYPLQYQISQPDPLAISIETKFIDKLHIVSLGLDQILVCLRPWMTEGQKINSCQKSHTWKTLTGAFTYKETQYLEVAIFVIMRPPPQNPLPSYMTLREF